jgi:predicted transcriptional regulator
MIYRTTTRTRTEIMSQILSVAKGRGITKSNIMYKAFLGYHQLNEYLRVLTENSLLSYDAYTRTFKTTEKGLKFLKIYHEMDNMIKAAS